MKLEIDLMNADEVAAGLVLLGKIGEAQAETKATVRTAPANVANFIQRTQVEEGEVFMPSPGALPGVGEVPLDPAAVFGGTPVADPLPSSTIAPPPPVSIVPTTPIPGPASSVAAVELDVKGLPWDSRIHSSSKNKLANGCWKVARGKAPEYVAQVEAELKGVPLVIPAPIIATEAATPYPQHNAPGPHPGTVVAVPPPAYAGVAVPPSPNATTVEIPPSPSLVAPSTFETLMTRISPQISAGILPPQAVMDACKANGLQSVVGLQSSPQPVPLVWATLKATYPALV